MKTVKELENQLNISRVSVYARLKKPEYKEHTFKDESGVTCVDDIGVALLEAYYLQGQQDTISDMVDEELIQYANDLSINKVANEVKHADIIILLRRQIEEKDNQIDNLLKIVLNQQQLHVTQFLTNKQPNAEANRKPMSTTAKGFFKRLFPPKKAR